MHFIRENKPSIGQKGTYVNQSSNMTRMVVYVAACLLFILLLNLSFNVRGVIAPPVDNKPSTTTLSPEEAQEQLANRLEYEKYLREVVEVLEANPEIRQKIENASQDDIKSGKIVDDLDFASFPDIRSKLDEAKRTELDRLGLAVKMQHELENLTHDPSFPKHVHNRDSKFNKDDLKKLIIEATNDLERLDKERREQYKRKEMGRKLDEEKELENKQGEELERAKREISERNKKHADHEPLNHPMSKDQLQEVWEEEDKMPKEDFDSKTFFNLHDLDGDGFLNEEELEALFQNELDKAYNDSNSNYYAGQREEEKERMREHVMKEMDKNKDRMIDFNEFMSNTNSADFEQDPGWDTLDKQPAPFSDEEFKEFERNMQQQQQQQQNVGSPDAHKVVVGEPPASRPDAAGHLKDNTVNNHLNL